MAASHEQAVTFAAAKTQVGTAFGQRDMPDGLALWIEYAHAMPTDIDNFQVWQKQEGKWLLIGRQAYKY